MDNITLFCFALVSIACSGQWDRTQPTGYKLPNSSHSADCNHSSTQWCSYGWLTLLKKTWSHWRSRKQKKHKQQLFRLEAFSPKCEKNTVIRYNLFGEVN